jgi:hypothetical protein
MRASRVAIVSIMLLLLLEYQLPAQTLEKAQPTPNTGTTDPAVDLVKKPSDAIALPKGTKLALVLTSAVTSRSAKPGDPVYFETIFPVIQANKVIVPAGSFVQGQVAEAKRAGRIKGRAELLVRMNQLILPNGYVASLMGVPTGAGTGANETVEKEGVLKGDTDRMNDAGTIVRTTALGAGIGSAAGVAAGNVARGAGIGLGAGAAVGILAVLLSRGPEIDLERGTTVDVELERPLYLDRTQVNFTDTGHASSIAAPPERRPARTNRFPY